MTRLRGEDGVGLVELVIALALMTIVAGIAYAGLGSFVTSSKAIDDRALATDATRTALERIVRDLRAANPIDALPGATPVSAYDTAVSFSVHCSPAGTGTCNAQGLRPLRYETVAGELRRTEGGVTSALLRPTGPTSVPLTVRAGAIVNTAAEPVFAYYDVAGDPLVTSGPDAVTSTLVRDCARTVEVHLRVQAQDRDADAIVDLRTRVDIRNFHEVSSCTA